MSRALKPSSGVRTVNTLGRGAVIEPKLVPGGLVVWADSRHVLVVLTADDGKLLVT